MVRSPKRFWKPMIPSHLLQNVSDEWHHSTVACPKETTVLIAVILLSHSKNRLTINGCKWAVIAWVRSSKEYGVPSAESPEDVLAGWNPIILNIKINASYNRHLWKFNTFWKLKIFFFQNPYLNERIFGIIIRFIRRTGLGHYSTIQLLKHVRLKSKIRNS